MSKVADMLIKQAGHDAPQSWKKLIEQLADQQSIPVAQARKDIGRAFVKFRKANPKPDTVWDRVLKGIIRGDTRPPRNLKF